MSGASTVKYVQYQNEQKVWFYCSVRPPTEDKNNTYISISYNEPKTLILAPNTRVNVVTTIKYDGKSDDFKTEFSADNILIYLRHGKFIIDYLLDEKDNEYNVIIFKNCNDYKTCDEYGLKRDLLRKKKCVIDDKMITLGDGDDKMIYFILKDNSAELYASQSAPDVGCVIL